MSTSPSIDAYDAQMLDFSFDPDVPMNITGSAELFVEALMDHDGHLVASTYPEHASVEIDMEEYAGDNAEYEMADETADYQRPHGDELLDIEVYDASHAPSPLAPPQPLQPPVDVAIDSEHQAPTSPAFSEPATLPEAQGEPESEVHPAPLDHPPVDALHVEPLASGEVVSPKAVSLDLAHPTSAPDESIPPISESHEQLGDTPRADEQLLTPAPADAHGEAEPHVPPAAEEYSASSEVVQQEGSDSPVAESVPPASTDGVYDSGPPVQGEKAVEQVPVTEGETVDPLHISDDVYIDPPPAVLLSITDLSEPAFTLFNQPDVDSESAEESHSNHGAYSLLLENRPTLYYEPLSNVFEALRRDEGFLSRVPHSFEGELVLDAYDLQLAVSEDNVHSREISLHDLNVLLDGSNFAGPLRLLLRAIVPRFIIRYYTLQEQIQRLNIVAEAGQEEHDEEHHEHYDTGEEKLQPQQEQAASQPSPHTTAVSEGLEELSTKEVVKESALPPDTSEENLPKNDEPQDTSVVHELADEYHEATGDATHVLEDEGDYDGANAGDEDESDKSDRLGDQAHDTATEDPDAPATVTGQGSEFGGEQTEYLDYVQPEEYDERYGEEPPERAGVASSAQYSEVSHYEEGELDTSAVDDNRTVLPDLEEDEEDKSVATPIPPRAILELGSSELADDNESVSPEQDESAPGEEPDETTDRAVHKQASGNQETSTAEAKIFSEVDESDSNFVSTLEREADVEFDRTFDRIFNPEQNGQEASVEATLQHDEIWDEWDDEDAEGEDDEDWIDPDAASNESSVTLSSKASSKRSYDDVDPSGDVYAEDSRHSPGLKRPRVQ